MDLSKLCVHTITTKPWDWDEAVENFSKAGVKGITVWRDTLEKFGVSGSAKLLKESGLEVVSLCRGGFFPGVDSASRQTAIDDNLKAIDEAAEIGAPLIVLVCGANENQDLFENRKQIQEGIEAVLPHAKSCGIKLAIEPLHPMYADTRSAVNTLGQANDMVENIGDSHVGVAVDVYHLWWDPALENEIKRCGALNALLAFHVCDWRLPTRDFLLDRGLMGEGCIDIKKIRGWVEAAGFSGFNEVEIFSNEYWAQDQNEFLQKIIQAYQEHC